MKFIWKGKMTSDNSFVYESLPKTAQKLVNTSKSWTVYLLIVPILLVAYTGIRIRLHSSSDILFNKPGLLLGVGLSVVFLVFHEMIHGLCCPPKTEVLFYFTLSGFCTIPTSPLRKSRYLFMLLMPTALLGVIPFLLWILLPNLSVVLGSILFGFSLGSLSTCIGDIYNSILAAKKMSSKAVMITSGQDCYYYEATEQ